METWCFLGILFSLPHNKADVYVCAALVGNDLQQHHNYIPEKRKFPGILCFRQPRRRRHNFVVSAITFEGFKLHSSNLIHALFIQISRTSSIIDIVVSSKMAAGGHFVKK